MHSLLHQPPLHIVRQALTAEPCPCRGSQACATMPDKVVLARWSPMPEGRRNLCHPVTPPCCGSPTGVGPGCTDETLLSAIASALHTSTLPITGQLSAAVEKNPGVWLNTAQPLCKAFMVTDDDIR